MIDPADPSSTVDISYDAADLRSLYGACRKCRRNLILIALAPIVIGLISAIGTDWVSVVVTVAGDLVLGLLIGLGIYGLMPILQSRARRKYGWDSPIVFSINGQSINSFHPSQNTQFPWSAIKDVVAKPDRLFLFTTPACALIFPRRCFVDQAQFDDWTERARHYWNEARLAPSTS